MSQISIGIQGIAGSFSESAAQVFANQHHITKFTPVYLTSSVNVLAHVANKQVDYGIFAIENSTGGIVLESIEAMAHYQFHIEARFSILIEQNLLALPNTNTKDLKAIYSHRQALRQCQRYLNLHHPDCEQIEFEDTAKSAQLLAHGQFGSQAGVIANRNCAKLYDLEILAPNIQDQKDNQTLFLAVSAYQGHTK